MQILSNQNLIKTTNDYLFNYEDVYELTYKVNLDNKIHNIENFYITLDSNILDTKKIGDLYAIIINNQIKFRLIYNNSEKNFMLKEILNFSKIVEKKDLYTNLNLQSKLINYYYNKIDKNTIYFSVHFILYFYNL